MLSLNLHLFMKYIHKGTSSIACFRAILGRLIRAARRKVDVFLNYFPPEHRKLTYCVSHIGILVAGEHKLNK